MKISQAQLVTILICFLMNMLDGMDVMVVSYAATSIAKDWSMQPKALGIVFSAGLLGMSIGAMFLAPQADKIGRKSMILICNILMGISVFGTSFSSNIEILTFFRILSGLGIGGMLASTATLTSENAPAATKDFWVSFAISGYTIGAVLSGLASAYLIPIYGWPIVFQMAGVASFVTLPIVYYFLIESKEFIDKVSEKKQASVKELLTPTYKKATLGLWVSIFLVFASLYFLTTWIPNLASATGLSVKLAIYAGTVFNLGAFCGIIFQGYLSSIFGLNKTIFGFLIATSVAMVVFGFFSGSILVLILFGLIGFGIQGGFVGMYSLAAKMYPTEIRATGVGWAIGAGRIGAVFGPLIGGFLIAAGFSMATNFIFFAIPTFISGVLILVLKK